MEECESNAQNRQTRIGLTNISPMFGELRKSQSHRNVLECKRIIE